jgi:hypothetical protein
MSAKRPLGKELERLDMPIEWKFATHGKHVNTVSLPISRDRDGNFRELRYSGKPGTGGGTSRKRTTK